MRKLVDTQGYSYTVKVSHIFQIFIHLNTYQIKLKIILIIYIILNLNAFISCIKTILFYLFLESKERIHPVAMFKEKQEHQLLLFIMHVYTFFFFYSQTHSFWTKTLQNSLRKTSPLVIDDIWCCARTDNYSFWPVQRFGIWMERLELSTNHGCSFASMHL